MRRYTVKPQTALSPGWGMVRSTAFRTSSGPSLADAGPAKARRTSANAARVVMVMVIASPLCVRVITASQGLCGKSAAKVSGRLCAASQSTAGPGVGERINLPQVRRLVPSSRDEVNRPGVRPDRSGPPSPRRCPRQAGFCSAAPSNGKDCERRGTGRANTSPGSIRNGRVKAAFPQCEMIRLQAERASSSTCASAFTAGRIEDSESHRSDDECGSRRPGPRMSACAVDTGLTARRQPGRPCLRARCVEAQSSSGGRRRRLGREGAEGAFARRRPECSVDGCRCVSSSADVGRARRGRRTQRA